MRSLVVLGMAFALGASEVEARIAALVEPAQAIRIDGRDGDWATFYAVEAEADAPRARGYGIAAIAIAPSAEALAICVRPAERFTRSGGALWLKLDVAGESAPDFILGCYWRRAHTLDVITQDGGRERVVLDGIEAELDRVLELRLPWRALEAAIPPGLRATHALPESGVRSWIRVQAEAWSYARGDHVCRDRGLAVASPLLVTAPPPLDPPPALAGPDPLTMAFPLEGPWYCGQAADGRLSHRGFHAYDLVRFDRSHRAHPGVVEADGGVAERYAHGAPIRAGVAGRVVAARDGHDDSPIGSVGEATPDNALEVLTADGLRLGYGHLRRDSLAVAIGDAVDADTLLAEIGNSGASNGPHLHLVARDLLGTTRPIAFSGVRVALNPTADDPWARDLERWIPRDGFFVSGPTGGAAPRRAQATQRHAGEDDE